MKGVHGMYIYTARHVYDHAHVKPGNKNQMLGTLGDY